MKRTAFIVLLAFSVFTLQSSWGWASENIPMCRLGANPVDISRDVNWGMQCLLTLNHSQTVTMGDGNGNVTKCSLATGTSVVIEKDTGRALYPRFCTNPLIGNPILSGQRDCAPEPQLMVQKEQSEVKLILSDAPYAPSAQPSTADLEREVSPPTRHRVWPWIFLGVVIIAAAASSGGGGHHNPVVRPGSTIL